MNPACATLTRCLGVVRTVADVERSLSFYAGLFGFEALSSGDDGARLRLGDMTLDLRRAAPDGEGAPKDMASNTVGFRHIAIVVRDMRAAFETLLATNVALISSRPQTLPAWNTASAGIEALYFRDPDGLPLELIRFPEGKGKPEWHRAGSDLFMGADHTAIVVGDTAASLDFYTKRFGFAVAATAHNYGVEQDALSGVKGASVLVTSLAAADGGFGLELLEYLPPSRGILPAERARPGDLLWSETVIAAGTSPLDAGARFTDPDGYGVSLT